MDQVGVLNVGEAGIVLMLGVGGVDDVPIGRAVAQVLLRQGPQVVTQLDCVGQLLLSRGSGAGRVHPQGQQHGDY